MFIKSPFTFKIDIKHKITVKIIDLKLSVYPKELNYQYQRRSCIIVFYQLVSIILASTNVKLQCIL